MQKIKLFKTLIPTLIIATAVLPSFAMATSVNDYISLKNAIKNPNVASISITRNIVLTNTLQDNDKPIARNLLINGNGHILSGNQPGFFFKDISSPINIKMTDLKLNSLKASGNNGVSYESSGAGIYLEPHSFGDLITISGVNKFISNSAPLGGGGAIISTVYGEIIATINFNGTAIFNKNIASQGGAIANGGNIFFNNNSNTNSFLFTKNKADYGGAILNIGKVIFNGNSIFKGNIAKISGGAISNAFNSDNMNSGVITFKSNSEFSKNKASTGYGGAIYNDIDATINFSANTVFSKNIDSTGPNDIYNDGIVNINAGTATLGGGITGTGALNIKSDANLNLGTSAVTQDKVNFAKGSTLDIKYTKSAASRITNTDRPTIGTGAKLIINKAQIYRLFDKSPASGNVFSNLLYNIKDISGTYKITSKNPAQIINAVNANTGVMLGTNDANALISLDNLNHRAANSQVVNIFKGAQIGDITLLNQVKYLTYSSAPIIQSIATGSQNSIIDITGRRVSLINETKLGLAPWVQLIYNHQKQNATGDNPGFDSNARGAAIGLDKTTADYIIGFGYAYNDTNLSSNGTDIDADGHNIFTYAHYKIKDWFVNGIINAGFSDYSDENLLRNTKHNVNAYGGQILTGYDFSGLKPEIGARYIYINTGSYTDSIGTHFNLNNINVLTGVLGGIYSKEFTGKNNKFTITPEVKLGATYDIVSSDHDGSVTILGGANSYNTVTNKLPRFGVEAGIGTTLRIQQFYITLNYDAFIRKDYISQTGMLKFKFEL